jgi:hypothetical protein
MRLLAEASTTLPESGSKTDLEHPLAGSWAACFFKGANCSLAIKINSVEADTAREADVGCRMILESPLDHFKIDRGASTHSRPLVIEKVSAALSG